jgi:hypothetical protein
LAVMGTYHFRRLFGKHLTGVTSSTRVSRQGHGARLSGRLRYNSAARLADGRRPSRRPAAARAPRRARARRRAASGERREYLMESCGPALWGILKPPGSPSAAHAWCILGVSHEARAGLEAAWTFGSSLPADLQPRNVSCCAELRGRSRSRDVVARRFCC